ncbi:hypothetical protein Cpin_5197 [Chitinophaga pinensis DSM 2588]|uniref:Uncharacterized protein n=1 Tax=Chitinophaga pinensis (strain ATCC 43595 / DSM 2588 / LMG 13176 / NBRC 15968 / NCIMB 11800 / UQM 2034) TaxID=485918 RepID=A0A979GU95_CHIPD|nr:hypothetical protein Cpin_5197 [Chitinophaga pinensis DSM 2588]
MTGNILINKYSEENPKLEIPKQIYFNKIYKSHYIFTAS